MRALAVAWVVAWVVAWAVVTVASSRTAGYDLPYFTHGIVAACDALRAGWGIALFGLALSFGLSPLLVAPHGRAVKAWLGVGLVQAGAFTVLALASFERARTVFSVSFLAEPPSPRPLPEPSLLADAFHPMLVVVLAVGALQCCAWYALSREALRAPRDDARHEALRALVIAALPAPILGALAAALVEQLGLGSSLLVVPAPLAALGTTGLLCYGGALWTRARREPAHE